MTQRPLNAGQHFIINRDRVADEGDVIAMLYVALPERVRFSA